MIKKLAINFSSLTVLQISNYVIPLIVFPYLVRVLGPEKYGLVNFAFALVSFWGIILDFGFNLSATRYISINRKDDEKIKQAYSAIFAIKLFFIIIGLGILSSILTVVADFKEYASLYYLSFFYFAGLNLFPNWFLQGIEKMSGIAIIQISVKFLTTVLVFSLVTSSSDYLLYVMIQCFASISIAIIGLFFIRLRFKINFVIPQIASIKERLNDTKEYFYSMVTINIFSNSSYIVLGIFGNSTLVGIWVGADKIRLAIQSIIVSIGQTIYPHFAVLSNKSHKLVIKTGRKFYYWGGGFFVLLSIILFAYSPEIVSVVLGEKFTESVILLRIISICPIFSYLSNIKGIQVMLNLGYKKEFSKIMAITSILNLFLVFVLIPLFTSIGAAMATLLTEVVILYLLVSFSRNKKIYK